MGADILRGELPTEEGATVRRATSTRRVALPVRSPPPVRTVEPPPDPSSGIRTRTEVVVDPIVSFVPRPTAPLVQPQAPLPQAPTMEFEEVTVRGVDFTGLSRPVGEPFVHRRIGAAIGGFVTGGAVGAVTGFIGGGAAPAPVFTGADRGQGLGGVSCPPGAVGNTNTGVCETPGFLGTAQRFVPGGATGTIADAFGEAVMGSFGIPVLVPAQVGTISRRDGSVGPILRCPPGMVLAVDNLCYSKGTRGLASFRKWKPGTRPFLTGGEVRVLRRAETLRRGKSTKKTLKALGLGG